MGKKIIPIQISASRKNKKRHGVVLYYKSGYTSTEICQMIGKKEHNYPCLTILKDVGDWAIWSDAMERAFIVNKARKDGIKIDIEHCPDGLLITKLQ